MLTLFLTIVAISFASRIALILYRLSFHPLAEFPGPKIAAASRAYEFYWSVVKPGKFMWKIKEMHDKYGPVVRINPYELHILDPDFYSQFYNPTSGSRKRDKYDWWLPGYQTNSATVSTISHDQHRMRRSAVNKAFSQKTVQELEPIIKEKINKLVWRLQQAGSSETIRMDWAYTAVTLDIICSYCFGVDQAYLDKPEFAKQWKSAMITLFSNVSITRFLPWLPTVFAYLPNGLLKWLGLQTPVIEDIQEMVRQKLQANTENTKLGRTTSYKTVLQHLMESDLPAEELTTARLVDEAVQFVGGGSDSTGKVLATMTFHLAQRPDVVSKMRAELGQVSNIAQCTWPQLASQPYISAVVREGIRITNVATSRHPRRALEVVHYREWSIPAYTPVSQSPYWILYDSNIFPEPETFKPERWLGGAGNNLERNFVAFNRGPRDCLGRNLALAEIYLVIASMYSQFDFELVDTTINDVQTARDFLLGHPDNPYAGVKARVHHIGQLSI